jgi:hypothetical protein
MAASTKRVARSAKPAILDLGVFEPMINMPLVARQAGVPVAQPASLGSPVDNQLGGWSGFAIAAVICFALGWAFFNVTTKSLIRMSGIGTW